MQSTEDLIIQNRLLMQEVKRRIDQIGAINTVAAAVGQSLDLDFTLETALRAVLDVVGAEAGGISLIDEDAQEVVLRAQSGWIHDFVTSPMRIPLGQGMSGQVIRTNDMIVHNNLDGTEEYAVPSFKEEHFRSIAMAPMRARGKIIGILSIMSQKPHQFNEEIINVLRAVADTVGVSIDNARLYENTVEQEKRLSAVLESSADGIIAVDMSGRITVMNQTAHNMLDVKTTDVVGKRLNESGITPTVRDLFASTMTTHSEERNRVFQISLENEKVLAALVSPVLVNSQVDQKTGIGGWVIVLQDVTHLRKAEIARAQFIQAAAHDMRNPLTVTQSSLNLLKEIVQEKSDEISQIFDIALNGVDRLQALIDDLLHLEHIESGYGFNRTEIDLGELLYEVSAEIKPLMEHKTLKFSQEIEKGLKPMLLDRRWINRALHNYLENATKYTQQGGSVTLRAFIKKKMLHLEVSDTGPGVPMSAQPHLFERFYRVKGTENIHGTGLGLAIVKSVAEAHQGSVYVVSREGQGSTFGMALPLSS